MTCSMLRPYQVSSLIVLMSCLMRLNAFSDDTQAKEIYGTDDRLDIYQVTSSELLSSAKAVCAFVSTSLLVEEQNGFYSIDYELLADYSVTFCGGVTFASQPQLSFCTGFLVGTDVIATAGHCVMERGVLYDLGSYRIVFGYQMEDETTVVDSFSPDQVYSVVNVEEAQNSQFRDLDYAVLRLNRNVILPGVEPLVLRQSGKIEEGEAVGVIGHPLGWPMKIAFGNSTTVYPGVFGYPNSIITNFDSSSGGSGSPVFNQETGLVEGIYIFSFKDDVIYEGDCARINRLENGEAGQGVQKAETFRFYVELTNNQQDIVDKWSGCAAGQRDGGGGKGVGDVLMVLMLVIGCVVYHGKCNSPRA